MTTTALVQKEIARFLSSHEPEVLCISGKWGVGKTYTWLQNLKAALTSDNLYNNRYAYVSLFGINTLDEFKYAIFENTVATDQIEQGPSHKSLIATLKEASHYIEKHVRKGSYLINTIPIAKEILQGGKSAFLVVRDQLICIDDLERHSADLSLKDVLGLVSVLKEQRTCKVVLLLNQDELPKESRADFNIQLEKVVDIKVVFDPTPLEAVEIGINDETIIAKYLKDFAPKLGIKNIRVIQKIEAIGKRLAEILDGYHEGVLRQAIHTSTLFGWIHFQPNEAPSESFVRDHDWQIEISFSDTTLEKTDEEKAWLALLSTYEFNTIDEFDALIIKGITQGFFDETILRNHAEALEEKLKFEDLNNSFSEAWRLYHDSFKDNESEVLSNLTTAFKSSVQIISPLNLSGTVSLFKDLGHHEEAKALIDYYMNKCNKSRDFFDLSKSSFREDVKDPDVVKAFDDKLNSFTDSRDKKDILIYIGKNSGWNEGDLECISSLTVANFKDMFKENEGNDLRNVIYGALKFRNLNGISEEAKQMSFRAETALREIASESKLNARRVSKYGIYPSKTDEV